MQCTCVRYSTEPIYRRQLLGWRQLPCERTPSCQCRATRCACPESSAAAPAATQLHQQRPVPGTGNGLQLQQVPMR